MARGIFGTQGTKKMARPLVYAPQPMRGLAGALGDVVPWQCWDKSGFKDCHGAAWKKANTYCKDLIAIDRSMYGGDVARCTAETSDAYAWSDCVPKYCPPVKTSTGLSWRNSTPNSAVSKLQSALNTYLKSNNVDTLIVDGLLGSGTCGAAYYVDDWEGTTFYRDYQLAKICQTMKVPTRGGVPVVNVAVAPQVTITKDSAEVAEMDLPWEKFHADTEELQRRLNVQLDSADMNLLAVNGKLNAPTCGAMKWQKDTQGIDVLSTSGGNCQGFVAPTKKIKVATPVAIPGGGGAQSPLPGSGARTSAASMATTGLIVAALGVGTYFVGKKYNWF